MLEKDSIHIWRVRLNAAPSQATVASWRSLLSNEERHRTDAFRFDEHRSAYLISHVALRTVLASVLHIPPAKVLFANAATQGAKPQLAPETTSTDLQFNLSHTKGQALIGVALGINLGIDIEWHRSLDDLEAMAMTVMSATEFKLWQKLEPASQRVAFYNLWTRKESYLKAIGLGLYRGLQDVTVPVSANALNFPQEGGRVVIDSSGSGHWQLTDIPAPENYSASIAWEGKRHPRLQLRELVYADAEWHETFVQQLVHSA